MLSTALARDALAKLVQHASFNGIFEKNDACTYQVPVIHVTHLLFTDRCVVSPSRMSRNINNDLKHLFWIHPLAYRGFHVVATWARSHDTEWSQSSSSSWCQTATDAFKHTTDWRQARNGRIRLARCILSIVDSIHYRACCSSEVRRGNTASHKGNEIRLNQHAAFVCMVVSWWC